MKVNTFNNVNVGKWNMLRHFLAAFTVGMLLVAAVELASLKKTQHIIYRSILKFLTENVPHIPPQR